MKTLQSDMLLVDRMHNPGWQVVPPLLAPCPVRMVAALAFLLLSLMTVAPAQANCALVQIEAVAPLDFGLLRVEKKRSGWALVEPAGGYALSSAVSTSSKRPPFSGEVRVTAPPGSRLMLSLTPLKATTEGPLKLVKTTLAMQNRQPLVRTGEFWELTMPASEKNKVSVTLVLGGELKIEPTEKIWNVQMPLAIKCVECK